MNKKIPNDLMNIGRVIELFMEHAFLSIQVLELLRNHYIHMIDTILIKDM